jgi:hypothetical protein
MARKQQKRNGRGLSEPEGDSLVQTVKEGFEESKLLYTPSPKSKSAGRIANR